ncbi:MAG TPA: hypothetical protein VHS31_10985 [Tepidisphaeraceae bacterium]|jgi:hypothetical protein|nr:hypothetical protein [Tepidisphaeraceae bacterium]
MGIGPFIGIAIALTVRKFWSLERFRSSTLMLAAALSILVGLMVVGISAEVAREEYGFGTLIGGQHGPRMLFLTTAIGFVGLLQLAFGVYVLATHRQRALQSPPTPA